MRRAVTVIALWASGCAVDPLPEPPVTEPQLLGDFDGGVCGECDGQASLTGAPGSVANADVLWAVNLDLEAAPVVVPVDADGSFGLFIPAVEGNEVRIQARAGDQRSAPLDLVMLLDGGVAVAPRPLAGCFVVAPELALPNTAVGATGAAVLRLEHTCAAPLQVDAVALRAASTDFAVSAPSLPLVLAPGEFVDVAIDFTPAGAGLREEVLLVEISQPEVDRRPITLFGRAP